MLTTPQDKSNILRALDEMEKSLEKVSQNGRHMDLRAVAVEFYNKSVQTTFRIQERVKGK